LLNSNYPSLETSNELNPAINSLIEQFESECAASSGRNQDQKSRNSFQKYHHQQLLSQQVSQEQYTSMTNHISNTNNNNSQRFTVQHPQYQQQSQVIRKHTSYVKGFSGSSKLGNGLITLVVDETRFMVDPDMFRQHSNTMLGRMFR